MTIKQMQDQIDLLQAQLDILKGQEPTTILSHHIASPGKVFQRNHDKMILGNEIVLGYDYSTGNKRKDKIEYYTEVNDPNYKEEEGSNESSES